MTKPSLLAGCAMLASLGWLSALADNRSSTGRDAGPRYTAVWEDGAKLDGDELGPWHDTFSQPYLAGRAVLSVDRPVRWVQANLVTPARPGPMALELIGWDRIPGRVVGIRAASDSPYPPLPAHFIVAVDGSVDRPSSSPRDGIRVPARWVRRVLWQPMALRYQPATVFLRDGRQIAFRAVRLADDALRVLKQEGVEEIPLAALAELHFPASDPWDAYFEQLAVLSPDADTRLIQLETESGLRATYSAARFQAESGGNSQESARWYHVIQPAWSLDPLWIAFRRIRLWRHFDARQVPLSWIPPAAVRQQSTFGSAWTWQIDRSVQGTPLAGADTVFQWGFGVHATTDLEFPLPPGAEAFRARVGIDSIMGSGGCAQASVRLAAADKLLYESRPLVGARETADTGRVAIPAAAADERLLLRVDALDKNHPPGADPFDIRDHVDWFEPELHVRGDALRVEIARRLPRWVPAWSEWDISGRLRLVSYFQSEPIQQSQFRVAVSADNEVRVARRVTVGPQRGVLVLGVSRPADGPPSQIVVRVGNEVVKEIVAPPRRYGREPSAVEIPLTAYHGQTVDVNLTQSASDRKALVEWERLEFTPAPSAGQ